MEKEKQVKKLLIRTVVFFILAIAIWLAACLLSDETNKCNTILAALSLIPTLFYIINAYKLNTLLEIEKYFTFNYRNSYLDHKNK